jgi:hypothetical protein
MIVCACIRLPLRGPAPRPGKLQTSAARQQQQLARGSRADFRAAMAELARVPVRPAWEHDVAAWVAEDMLAFPDATGYVNALFLNDREHANRVDDVIRALGDAKRSIGLTGYIHRTQWSSPPYDVIVVFGHPFTSAGKQLRAALTNNALRPGGIVFAIYCVSHDHEAVACHRPCTFEADEGWLDPVPMRDFESENDPETFALHRWYDTELTRWHLARYRYVPERTKCA